MMNMIKMYSLVHEVYDLRIPLASNWYLSLIIHSKDYCVVGLNICQALRKSVFLVQIIYIAIRRISFGEEFPATGDVVNNRSTERGDLRHTRRNSDLSACARAYRVSAGGGMSRCPGRRERQRQKERKVKRKQERTALSEINE